MKKWLYYTVAALIAFSSSSSYALTISSTFDTNDEGWIGIPGEGSASYSATGGNPGGHISVTDIGSGGLLGSGAVAPGKFLGDLSAFDGGTLSVDLASIAGAGGPTWSVFGLVWIQGGGTEAFHDLIVNAPPIGGSWVSLSTTLDAASWGVSDAVWASILANVTEIQLGTDAFNGADTIGVDNFSIATAAAGGTGPSVPEPPTIGMLSLGLVGLAFVRRKRVN